MSPIKAVTTPGLLPFPCSFADSLCTRTASLLPEDTSAKVESLQNSPARPARPGRLPKTHVPGCQFSLLFNSSCQVSSFFNCPCQPLIVHSVRLISSASHIRSLYLFQFTSSERVALFISLASYISQVQLQPNWPIFIDIQILLKLCLY